MKLFYRSIVFLLTIIFMFSNLVLAFYTFGLAEKGFLPEYIENLYMRWEIGFLFLLAFLGGACVLYPFFTLDEKNKKTNISSSELGDVNITLGALDNLVKKVVLRRKGIEKVKTILKNSELGLNITLTAKVKSDLVIPELTDELQNLVKTYLEDTTGVTVNNVSILIDEIAEKENITTAIE